MKRTLYGVAIIGLAVAMWLMAQPPADPLSDGFRYVEVASVADAMEQLYGQKGYMSHEMRPLATSKFAGTRNRTTVTAHFQPFQGISD